jgi:cysteinyl-tRNA synthetase
MLEFGGEKMSKSLGNDVSIRNVLDTWGREVALVFFLSGHWRKPIDFTDETLAQAKSQWQSFSQALYEARPARPTVGWEAFEAALDDDFNTPGALAVLHEWRRASELELLRRGLSVFGLGLTMQEPPDEVRVLVDEREAARAAKDWQRSDELRDRIAAVGWIIQDGPDGPTLVPS